MPLVTRPDPDLTGFAEAQAALRTKLGSPVTFLGPPTYTWPGGTPINVDTGMPFDPTVDPVTTTQTSDVVTCGVFFKAVNRGGAAQAALGSPAGWEERTRIFAIGPISAQAILEAAEEFILHGDHYKVDVVKVDEVVSGFQRVLVYGSAKQAAEA